MPYYNYVCGECQRRFVAKNKREPDVKNPEDMAQVIYTAEHRMEPTPEDFKAATICPRCERSEPELSFYDMNLTTYTRWKGWKDKAGVKRDMDQHRLRNNEDPYAPYRVPGEVEELQKKIKKMGQHKPRTKYYTNTKSKRKK